MSEAGDPPTYPPGIPGFLAGLRARLCQAGPEQWFVPPGTASRVRADAEAFVVGLLADPRIAAAGPEVRAAIEEWLCDGPTPGPAASPRRRPRRA
jgi:hypothetical protein